MRESVSEKVQLKAAGGIRDLEMALKVRQIGCTRFGPLGRKQLWRNATDKKVQKQNAVKVNRLLTNDY